jgi:hypothetical protein
MEKENYKKQLYLALTPLFILCIVVFINAGSVSVSKEVNNVNSPAVESLYSTEEQPSHEPVYVSIFKFIINCNPFQKESQL